MWLLTVKSIIHTYNDIINTPQAIYAPEFQSTEAMETNQKLESDRTHSRVILLQLILHVYASVHMWYAYARIMNRRLCVCAVSELLFTIETSSIYRKSL